MVANEEFQSLLAARVQRRLAERDAASRERSACLLALAPSAALPERDGRLAVRGSGGESSSSGSSAGDPGTGVQQQQHGQGGGEGEEEEVVGPLDLHAVRALEGEVLIGDCRNAAYLANVCSAPGARRRGVGAALLGAARALAREWGERGGRAGEGAVATWFCGCARSLPPALAPPPHTTLS